MNMQMMTVGNSGVNWAEYWPVSGRSAHVTRWIKALRCSIRPGWRVSGIVAGGNLGAAGSVLVTNRDGYWYCV